MSHSVKNINDKLVEQMLRFLWRQWSAVGVAGTEEINDHRIIDPEALLLVSTEFARHDARLFDEILDWLFQYGQRINLKRIFRIRKQYPLGNSEVLLAISSKLCARSSHIKWRSVTEKSLNKKNDGDGHALSSGGLIPLFPKIPYSEKLLASADMDFREQGYYRPAYTPRGMSQPPTPDRPCNLIFKMRALFGCNSRAEIMAWLLTHPSGHPARIARDINYFNKSVQATLNEMASSGHIHASRIKREKHFRLIREEWSFFCDSSDKQGEPPQWVHWAEILSAIQVFYQAINQPGFDEGSELFQTTQLRSVLGDLPYDFVRSAHKNGPDFLPSLLEDVEHLLA